MAFFRKLFAVACAGCLSVLAPSLQARDISLPKYSWYTDFGTYHKNTYASSGQATIQNDPLTEILSVSAVDVWGRIRSGFGIQPLDNQLVYSHEKYYAKRGEYFQRTTKRAERYLFHIVQECERRNMPTELALLPFIESSFNPHAHSPAKAEGLWQFIPSTGRQYSLSQNTFQDKRRDIIASTDAALTYLQRLYDMFGDWHLALASYNWGEGNVMRATRKAEAAGRDISFNGIFPYMPAETRNYVPKLLAVKNLVAHPHMYGIHLPNIENQPYFVKIGKTKDIDVAVAAKLSEMPLDEFKALNPQYRYVIPGGNSVHILLPKDKAQRFQRNLLSWSRPLSSWTSYQVTSARERIEDIAQKLNVSPEAIRQANNIPYRKALKFGSTILVPRTASFNRDIAPGVLDNAYIAYTSDFKPTPSEEPQNVDDAVEMSPAPRLKPSETLTEKPKYDLTPKHNIWTSSASSASKGSSSFAATKKSDVFITNKGRDNSRKTETRPSSKNRLKDKRTVDSRHERKPDRIKTTLQTRDVKNSPSAKKGSPKLTVRQEHGKKAAADRQSATRGKGHGKESAVKTVMYAKDSKKNAATLAKNPKSVKDSAKKAVAKNKKR